MISLIEDFLKDLPFEFETVDGNKSLPRPANSSCEWKHSRVQFHRVFENTVKQMVSVASLLKSIKSLDLPRIAILSADIYPETSEAISVALLKALKNIGLGNSNYFSNRRILTDQNLLLASLFDWSDPFLFSKFDLIFVLQSSNNFALLNEIAIGQKDYDHTIFFTSATGLTIRKLQSVLNSELVIRPFTGTSQNDGLSSDIPLFPFEDLKYLKSIFLRHLVATGSSDEDFKKLNRF